MRGLAGFWQTVQEQVDNQCDHHNLFLLMLRKCTSFPNIQNLLTRNNGRKGRGKINCLAHIGVMAQSLQRSKKEAIFQY